MRDLQVIGVLPAGTLALAFWRSPESTPTPTMREEAPEPPRPAENELQLIERRARGEMILNVNAIR